MFLFLLWVSDAPLVHERGLKSTIGIAEVAFRPTFSTKRIREVCSEVTYDTKRIREVYSEATYGTKRIREVHSEVTYGTKRIREVHSEAFFCFAKRRIATLNSARIADYARDCRRCCDQWTCKQGSCAWSLAAFKVAVRC